MKLVHKFLLENRPGSLAFSVSVMAGLNGKF